MFELAGRLALIVFLLLLALLFFRKRSSVPRVYTGVLLASWLFTAADQLMASAIPAAASAASVGDWSALGRSVFWGSIWIVYFHRSERVKATFARRLETTQPAPTPQAPALEPSAG